MAVDIESCAFYEKLTITELEDGKAKVEIDRSSPLRGDEFAKEVSAVFQENFLEALQERNVRVVSGAPIKLVISLGYAIKATGNFSEIRILGSLISFFKQKDANTPAIFMFEKNRLFVYPILFKPIDLSDKLRGAKFGAKRLSEIGANSVVGSLREKGDINYQFNSIKHILPP